LSGPIALHGGGEFLPGDERFLKAILALAGEAAPRGPVRIAVVPSAAARGRPEASAAHGVAAFERIAREAGVAVEVEALLVVDGATAEDPLLAARLSEANLIYLPGGDADLIPSLYPGTAAWAAIRAAQAGGAVLAGASAGAMALAAWTWTPDGVVTGLGLVPGIIVAPHADGRNWTRLVARFGPQRPSGVSVLGLAERTGVVITDRGPWMVVGEGEARWLPSGADAPEAAVVARDGETLPTGGA
jgi:cyanophycinase-like exopeptidase